MVILFCHIRQEILNSSEHACTNRQKEYIYIRSNPCNFNNYLISGKELKT